MSKTVRLFSYGTKHPYRPDWKVNRAVDVRDLRNPYNKPHLRPLNGTFPPVIGFVMADPDADELVTNVVNDILLNDDTSVVSFMCRGGHHRSVALAEVVATRLKAHGITPIVTHLVLDAEGQARYAE